MDKAPILFLDSGIGGLPYVESVRTLLPAQPFVYIADTAHFPYGIRPEQEILRIVEETTTAALAYFGPKLMVLACNTASVVALSHLRRAFDIPIVGVVPAVKPAAGTPGEGEIVVLSTARTADGHELARLIARFAGGTPVRVVAAGSLVSFVEEEIADATPPQRRAAARQALREVAPGRTKAVVLGCTHFTHLREEMQMLLGPDVAVVDSRDGVARRVRELVTDDQREAAAVVAGGTEVADGPVATGRDAFYVTGNGDTSAARKHYRALSQRYGMEFGGRTPWMHTQ
jgi:glutamate racemase